MDWLKRMFGGEDEEQQENPLPKNVRPIEDAERMVQQDPSLAPMFEQTYGRKPRFQPPANVMPIEQAEQMVRLDPQQKLVEQFRSTYGRDPHVDNTPRQTEAPVAAKAPPAKKEPGVTEKLGALKETIPAAGLASLYGLGEAALDMQPEDYLPPQLQLLSRGYRQARAQLTGKSPDEPMRYGDVFDFLAPGVADDFRSRAHELTQEAEETIQRANEDLSIDPGEPMYYVNGVLQAVAEMTPAVAATVVTRNPRLGAALMGSQVFGREYSGAIESGRTQDEAFRDALFYAGIETITEKVPLDFITRYGKKALSGVLAAGAAEGVQEAVTEALSIGYEAGVLDEDVFTDPETGEFSLIPALKRLRDAGIIGAGAGAVMRGGVETVRGTAKGVADSLERRAERQKTTQTEQILRNFSEADLQTVPEYQRALAQGMEPPQALRYLAKLPEIQRVALTGAETLLAEVADTGPVDMDSVIDRIAAAETVAPAEASVAVKQGYAKWYGDNIVLLPAGKRMRAQRAEEQAALQQEQLPTEMMPVGTEAPEATSGEMQQPVQTGVIDAAAAEAATSPENDLPEPTDAQKEAGNYKKGKVRLHGLDVSIENPAGTSRRPEWPPLTNHYGYIRRTEAADGEQLDAFLGPQAEDPSKPVFVVDQIAPETGAFDEQKALLGWDTPEQAAEGYRANYSPDWQGLGGLVQFDTLEQFKDWTRNADGAQPAVETAPAFGGRVVETPIGNQSVADDTSVRYEVERDEDDEGTFVTAYSTTAMNEEGTPLTIGHLHVPDENDGQEFWRAGDVYVHPERRRTGIATKMYQRMAEHLGKPAKPASHQSPEGKALWEGMQRKAVDTSASESINAEKIDTSDSFHNRPLAAEGLDSYRYRGRYGWIMIGAKDDADALNEAKRSTDSPITAGNLQRWDGERYVDVQPAGEQTFAERRRNTADRARVAALPKDERDAEIARLRARTAELEKKAFTEPMTGLKNRAAWEERDPKPAVAIADVDGLKWVNDNLGYESGDKLLKAIGEALGAQSGLAYRIGGDEFALEADTPEEAQRLMDAAAAALGGAEIDFLTPDGKTVTYAGLDISYGIGGDPNEAEARLKESRKEREASGEYRRGAKPRGIREDAAAGQQDQVDPAEEVNDLASLTDEEISSELDTLSAAARRRMEELSGGRGVPRDIVFSEFDYMDETQKERAHKLRREAARRDDPKAARKRIQERIAARKKSSTPLFSRKQREALADRDLIVQHNLTAEKLRHAARMGGIAVPSLAITKAGHPLENFGEITLLGDRDMANPRGTKNTRVFGADVYSPRYPEVTYRIDADVSAKIDEKLKDYRKDGERFYGGGAGVDQLTGYEPFKRYMDAKVGGLAKFGALKEAAAAMLREAGAKEVLFRGFTNSGDRSYQPHTLENVVKILKKNLRSGEGFSYGVGNLRAHFTPQFRSIQQIKDNKDLLVDHDAFQKVKEEVDAEFFKIVDALTPYYTRTREVGFADRVIELLEDAGKMGIPRALREWAKYGIEGVSADVQAEMAKFLTRLKHLPTEYFEAKILRAVDIGEFAAAVVPEGTAQDVLDLLESSGVPVTTYKAGDAADRARAIREAAESNPDIRFQRVFHGTPHRFDKFSLEAIGTGEGAQAFGWGLYFAGKREIAEYYRDALMGRGAITSGKLDSLPDRWQVEAYKALNQPNGPIRAEAARKLRERLPEEYRAIFDSAVASLGNLIQAEIPEDSELLDWDAPLIEQPEEVLKKLAKIGITAPPEPPPIKDAKIRAIVNAALKQDQAENVELMVDNDRRLSDMALEHARKAGKDIDELLEESGAGEYVTSLAREHLDALIARNNYTGERAYRDLVESEGSDKAASLALNAAGIPGLRYFDASSRSVGEGTRNYVIWDEDAVTVEAVNDELRQAKALLRRGTPATDPPQTQRTRRLINTIATQFAGRPYVQTVNSWRDLPDSVQQFIADAHEGAATKGVYVGGTQPHIYLVAENLQDERDATETLIHEMIGHYGVRSVLGESELFEMADQIAAAQPGKIREAIQRNGLNKMGLAPDVMKRIAAEEVIAYAAQDIIAGKTTLANLHAKVRFWFERIMAAIRRMLGLADPKFAKEATDAEIIRLIARAYDFVRTGRAARTARMGYALRSVNVPPFYSQLVKTINDKLPERAPPAEYLKQIQGQLGKDGLKPEEFKWSGLEDVLSDMRVAHLGKTDWPLDVKQTWEALSEKVRREVARPLFGHYFGVTFVAPSPPRESYAEFAKDRLAKSFVEEMRKEGTEDAVKQFFTKLGEPVHKISKAQLVDLVDRNLPRIVPKTPLQLTRAGENALNSNEPFDDEELEREMEEQQARDGDFFYADAGIEDMDEPNRWELKNYVVVRKTERDDDVEEDEDEIEYEVIRKSDNEVFETQGADNVNDLIQNLANYRQKLLDGIENDPEKRTNWLEYMTPGGDPSTYEEYLYVWENNPGERFTYSSHWNDAANVLLHVRSDYNRETPDGAKLHYIDELQSDWHQQARERGFVATDAMMEESKEKVRKQAEKFFEEHRKKFPKLTVAARSLGREIERVEEELRARMLFRPQEWFRISAVMDKLDPYLLSPQEFAESVLNHMIGMSPSVNTEIHFGGMKQALKTLESIVQKLPFKHEINSEGLELLRERNLPHEELQDTTPQYRLDLNEAIDDYLQSASGGIPFAPMAQSYQLVALKHQLQLAVQEGMDEIAIATGQRHADRWRDLASVDTATINKTGSTYLIESGTEDFHVDDANLDATFGTEIAQIIRKEFAKDDSTLEYDGTVGPPLRIPRSQMGRGLLEAYNSVQPKMFNKFLKRYGMKFELGHMKAAAGDPLAGSLPGDPVFMVIDNSGGIIERDGPFKTREEAEKAIRGKPKSAYISESETVKSVVPVWRAKITPAAREAATKHGFPLFQKRGDKEEREIERRMSAMERGEREAKDVTPEEAERELARWNKGMRDHAFKNWFGDSKVVDENGEPLVVYHGTTGDIEAFEPARIRAVDYDAPFNGFWFSSAQNASPSMRDATNVVPVFLAIENPAPADVWKKVDSDVFSEFNGEVGDEALRAGARSVNDEVRLRLEDMGYDGILWDAPPTITPEQETEFEKTGEVTLRTQRGGWITLKRGEFGIDLYSGKIANQNTHLTGGWKDIPDFLEFESEQVWVAFRPEQIKSQFNRGTFDRGDARILFAKADKKTEAVVEKFRSKRQGAVRQTLPELVKEWTQDWKARLNQYFFDDFYGLKRAEVDVAQLPKAQWSYVSARLARGVDDVLRTTLEYGAPIWDSTDVATRAPTYDRASKPFFEILAPLRDAELLEMWKDYVVAYRAKRLKAEDRENLFTSEEIETILKLSEEYPLLEQIRVEYAALNKKILDFAQVAGVINPETRALWENQDYVPFYRVIDDAGRGKVNGPFTGTGRLANLGKVIKTLRGGRNNMGDPVDNIIMNWSALLRASLNNHAGLLAIDNLTGTGLVTKARQVDFKKALVSREEVARRLKAEGAKLDDASLDGFMELFVMTPPAGENILNVFRNGKREYWEIHDPLLFRAMTAIGKAPFGPWMNIFRIPKRVLTQLITLSPEFSLRNWFRDALSSFILRRDTKAVPFWDGAKGFVKTLTKHDDFKDMMAGGATFESGYVTAHDPGAVQKVIRARMRSAEFRNSIIDKPMKYFEMYRDVTSSMENANRVPIYRDTLKQTGSRKLALYESKDIMDFSMRGDGMVIRFLAESVAFFNARLQGLYRIPRTWTEAATKGEKAKLASAVLVRGTMLMLPALILYLRNRQLKCYQDLPNYDKDLYFHFFVGDASQGCENMRHYRLPKPFEMGALFATVPERMLEAALSKEPDAGKQLADRLLWIFGEMLNMNPTPTTLEPMLELGLNKDFFRDAPVLNMHDQKLLPEMQYDYRTPPTYRFISQYAAAVPGAPDWLKSPKQLEHLVSGWGGTLFNDYAILATDAIVRVAQDYPPPPAKRLDEIPFVKSFAREHPLKYTAHMDAMYGIYEEVSKYAETAKEIEDQIALMDAAGNESMSARLQAQLDWLERTKEPELIAAGELNAAIKEIGGINEEIMMTTLDAEMSPKEKRKEIDALYEQRNEIAEEAIQFRPGGPENPREEEDDEKEEPEAIMDRISGMTRKQQVDALNAAGLPQTAMLVDSLPTRLPRRLQEELEKAKGA